MKRIGRMLLTALVMICAAGTLRPFVLEPYRQNQVVSLARADLERSAAVAVQRRNLTQLSDVERYDPYLRGWAFLYRARVLRELGRHDESATSYRKAIAHRVPPEARVEFGLFLIEIGRVDEGKNHLVRAIRFSDSYLAQIPSEGLQAEIYTAATGQIE